MDGSNKDLHIDDMLSECLKWKGSDLFVKANVIPGIRVNGTIQKTSFPTLSPDDAKDVIYKIMSDRQIQSFESSQQIDFSYETAGSRFRVHAYRQKRTVAAVLRVIPHRIPTLQELGLPVDVFEDIISRPWGLVLITGPTGSGKSTTLASRLSSNSLTIQP